MNMIHDNNYMMAYYVCAIAYYTFILTRSMFMKKYICKRREEVKINAFAGDDQQDLE